MKGAMLSLEGSTCYFSKRLCYWYQGGDPNATTAVSPFILIATIKESSYETCFYWRP